MSRKPPPATTTTIYHENWLMRKEGVKQWLEYWGVIRGKWLQFYERSDEYNRPELRKTLEITPNTKCSLVKRNKNRFPFSIDNGNGVYYMKVDTELERYHWIVSILCAALRKPKQEKLPDRVPDSMKETETFRKLTKQEKQELRNKNPMPPIRRDPIPAAEVTNKRRRKFAERRENKAKKKERKRLRSLGLDPDEFERQDEGKSDNEEEHQTQNRYEHHHRGDAERVTSQSMTSLRQNNNNNNNKNRLSINERLQKREMVLGSSPNNLHKNKTTTAEDKSGSTMAIKAMVHPPSQQQTSTITTKKTRSKKKSSSHYNRAFQGDDIVEEMPSCPVVLDGDDGLLPNMVFTGVSDDDDSTTDGESSDEENTTEEISLNSNNNESLLNIFGLASSGEFDSLQPYGGGTSGDVAGGAARRGSATIVSHTVLSDDGEAKQYSTTPITKRPTSAKKAPTRTLIERPLSPLNAQPLSPFMKAASRPTSPHNHNNNNKGIKKSEDFARFLDTTSNV